MKWRSVASGGAVLSLAMLLSNGANYGVNALTGRWLDPRGFADASLLVTLFLLASAGAVALQLMASRRVGLGGSPASAVAWLRARAWWSGIGAGCLLVLPAPIWQHVFSTASVVPFLALGLSLPVYLAQAVDRGVLQGELRFVALATTFLAEAAVRLAATVALLVAGYGANGVALALSLSICAAWAAGRATRPVGQDREELPPNERATLIGFARPALVLLVGQILVNNADILVVKALRPADAATYAAVALVGRAVFFFSWALVSALFPVATRVGRSDSVADRLDVIGVAVVATTGLVMTGGARLGGEALLGTVVGPGYASAAPLVWRYALATTAFTVVNVLASTDLARGVRRGPLLVLIGGALQTLVLLGSTASLARVVDAQVAAMALLLVVAGCDRLRRARSAFHPVAHAPDRAYAARPVAAVDLLA